MQDLYLNLTTIGERSEYTVVPFQQIIFSSMDFIKATLHREDRALILILEEHGKTLVLYDFFRAEHMGFFPTFILPTQECISGFGFIALLNPPLLQGDIQYKGGSYGKPAGSFIEYTTYRKRAEETIEWTISPILCTAPQSTIDTSVEVTPVVDESPEFYATIEHYLASVKEQNEQNALYKAEEPPSQEYEEEQEYIETYTEPTQHDVGSTNDFPSYHSGYIFTQEQIESGYRVIAVNGDTNEVEQLVGGYYGYLTLASEGWFTYILGEGVLPEIDNYLEDSYEYTVQMPDDTTVQGTITIQSYYLDGVLTYQDYYTHV